MEDVGGIARSRSSHDRIRYKLSVQELTRAITSVTQDMRERLIEGFGIKSSPEACYTY